MQHVLVVMVTTCVMSLMVPPPTEAQGLSAKSLHKLKRHVKVNAGKTVQTYEKFYKLNHAYHALTSGHHMLPYLDDYYTSLDHDQLNNIGFYNTLQGGVDHLMTAVNANLDDVTATLERLSNRVRPYKLQFTAEVEHSSFSIRLVSSKPVREGEQLELTERDHSSHWYLLDDGGTFSAPDDGPYLFMLRATTVDFTAFDLHLTVNGVTQLEFNGGGNAVTNMYLVDLVKLDQVKVIFASKQGELEKDFDTVLTGFCL